MYIIQMANPILIIFSVITFIMGIILVVTTIDAQQQLPDTCVNSNMNNALNVVILLSFMLTILPCTQAACVIFCDCEDGGHDVFKFIFGFIGIILAVCGGVIWQGAKECSASSVETYGVTIMSIGIIIPIIIFFYHKRHNIGGNKTKQDYSESSSEKSVMDSESSSEKSVMDSESSSEKSAMDSDSSSEKSAKLIKSKSN